jgi:hypothetical protein
VEDVEYDDKRALMTHHSFAFQKENPKPFLKDRQLKKLRDIVSVALATLSNLEC